MIAKSKQQEIKQAAIALARAEEVYLKLKEQFEMLLIGIQDGAQPQKKAPELPLHPEVNGNGETGTGRFMAALPMDGTPVGTKQLVAILGKDARWISATGSNLTRRGKIEKVRTATWRRITAKN
jgi:hypothetical protein